MKHFILSVVAALALAVAAPVAKPDTINPGTVSDVRDATYKLYVRLSPPGRRITQTFAFCTASFYTLDAEGDGREPGYYGTTAGHCLDTYSVLRSFFKSNTLGFEISLAVSAGDDDRNRFVEVEDVAHGFLDWREWREEGDEDMREHLRPDLSDIQDWGLLRAPADADLNIIDLVSGARDDHDDDSNWNLDINTGSSVYVSGYPYAFGKHWSGGVATPDYRLRGTIFDHVLAVDYVSAPGVSGAPVVNADGKQVAIHVASFGSGGPGLATPVTEVDFDGASSTITEGIHHPAMRYRRGHGMPLPDGVTFPTNMQAVIDRVMSYVSADIPPPPGN